MYYRSGILFLMILSLILGVRCSSNSDKSGKVEQTQKISVSEQIENHNEDTNIVELSQEAMDRISIKTIKVRKHALERSITVPARVICDQNREAFVGSLIGGRVFDVEVNQKIVRKKILKMVAIKVYLSFAGLWLYINLYLDTVCRKENKPYFLLFFYLFSGFLYLPV